MNMKKKLISLLLAMVMIVGTLSGCGNKKGNSYSSILRNTYDIEKGVYDSEIILTIDNATSVLSMLGVSDLGELEDYLINDKDQIKASLKMDGVALSRNPIKQTANISYKIGKMTDYQKFTELIIDNETVYFNLKDIVDTVAVYDPEILDEITLDKEYISITATEAEQYLGYEMSVDTTAFGDAESVEELLQETIFYVIETFEKASKGTDLFEESDDGYAMRLDEDNLTDVTATLVEYLDKNAEGIFDGYVKKLESIKGDNTDFIDQIKDSKASYMTGIAEAIKSFDKEQIESAIKQLGMKFAVDSYVECKGKDGDRVSGNESSITIEYEGIVAKLKLIASFDEGADTTINIPTDDQCYTYTQITELSESIMDSSNIFDDFEDVTDDDLFGGDAEYGSEDETYTINENPVADTKITPNKDLSSDMKSAQVQVDGKVLTLPTTYKELTDLGWKLASDFSEDDIVESDDFEFVYLEKDNSTLNVTLYNKTDEDKAYKDCEIWDIYVNETYFEEEPANVCLAAGIQVGSTYKDVIAAYGEPDYVSSYTYSSYYSYMLDEITYSITIDNETGLVSSFGIEWYGI